MEDKIRREDVADVLRTALKAGKTNFVFIKKDGSCRAAVGTLNFDIIPKEDTEFKSKERKEERTDQVTYYDLEKMSWRSCRADSILEIEGLEVSDK